MKNFVHYIKKKPGRSVISKNNTAFKETLQLMRIDCENVDYKLALSLTQNIFSQKLPKMLIDRKYGDWNVSGNAVLFKRRSQRWKDRQPNRWKND
jgi:hypothetical protein